jgi:hypothetical protein
MNLEFAKIALREACGDRGWEAGAIPRRRERSPFQPPSTEKGETGGESQREETRGEPSLQRGDGLFSRER